MIDRGKEAAGSRTDVSAKLIGSAALALGLTLAQLSCASGAGTAPSTGRATAAASTGRSSTAERGSEAAPVATLGRSAPVRLAPGESAALPVRDARLRFDRVLEDSRCPTGVTCVWAGRARVAVSSRTGASSELRSHELEVGSEAKGTLEVDGVRVRAVALEPPPKADIPPDGGAYRLVLELAEAKSDAR
jgi:hypothetical protein